MPVLVQYDTGYSVSIIQLLVNKGQLSVWSNFLPVFSCPSADFLASSYNITAWGFSLV